MSSVFGISLRAMRQRRGWTLEQVAKKIGSHKGYVSGIENDKVNPPSAKVVRRLARIFEMPYPTMLAQAELEKVHRDVPLQVLREAIDAELARRANTGVTVPTPAPDTGPEVTDQSETVPHQAAS